MLEKFCEKWTVNVSIAFLTCLATAFPVTRLGVFLLLVGYLLFGISLVLKNGAKYEQHSQGIGSRSFFWAFSYEFINFALFFVAIFVGVYLGWR